MEPTTSEYIIVNTSGIHNKGIFAKKDIPRDTDIIEYVGNKIPRKVGDEVGEMQYKKGKINGEGQVFLFELNKRYDIDGNVPYNTARYFNHSCEPNCEPVIINGKTIMIVSIKDIKQGEELTYDYGYEFDENFKDHICKCGKKNCIGYIISKEHWGKVRTALNSG